MQTLQMKTATWMPARTIEIVRESGVHIQTASTGALDLASDRWPS
jgi:hypothetical protein